MSMMARFVAVAPDQLAKLKRSPELVQDLFTSEATAGPFALPAAVINQMHRQSPQVLETMLARMPPGLREQFRRGLNIDGGTAGTTPAGGATPESISLEKAWHGLHYLLCGDAEPVPGPLGQAVMGGNEFGEDLGYGPARCFSAAETAEIATALQAPGLEATLRERFDPAAMESLGIYPGGWSEDEDAEEWLFEAFHELRDFYAAASAAGRAVVAVIE
jgi:hypothetical protein